MAGFSLGGGSGRGGQDDEIPPESLFLYPGSGAVRGGNDEIPAYPRGFELWQHQVPHQHQQQHQQHLYSSSGLLRFSDEPVPCGVAPGARGSGGGSGSGGGGLSCQDCGNQAKKDCSHLRCRTCCKSRGFQCVTHVKSTWVPASKRRERQQQLVTAAAYQQPPGRAGPSGEPSKRPREIITTTISGGGMEAVSLPSEVSSPAVFRCVRVSPMDDAEDEIAYQTAVSIGGHVFKGLLYDQGPAETQYHHGDSSSSAAAAAMITTTATISPALTSSAAATTTTAATSAGLLDPSALYPTPLSAFMAGTQFFPHHPRP